MSHQVTSQERALYLDLARRLGRGESAALAVIVRAWGATPREVGAKMLVDPEGGISGTVGGGCGEAEVWEAALEALRDGRPRLVHVDLTEDLATGSPKVCGGRLDVLVDLWQADLPSVRQMAEALGRALEAGRRLVLARVLGPSGPPTWKGGPLEPPPGLRLALPEEGEAVGSLGDPAADARLRQMVSGLAEDFSVRQVDIGGATCDVYLEVLAPPPRLVIAGAGHIARPLATLGALCGFSVTVVDDRPEYADRRLFPQADSVVCRPFTEFFQELACDPQTHVVLVTRGHRHDEDCLRCLAGRPAGYLGMIGSRRRTRAVFADLEAEGVDPRWLDQVHAPIGLDIGARTPEEIALAIMAEIIKVRRGGRAASLSLRQPMAP